MKGIGVDIMAKAAQIGFFLAGLALSIVIGMVLAAFLDGPGGLLIATIISGSGLLIAAGISQTLHDYILQRDLERHSPR
jgi:hypothetical protein